MSKFISKYLLGDKVIWGVVVFLSGFSIIVVYSASGYLEFSNAEVTQAYYIKRHITFIIIGFMLMFFMQKVKYNLFFNLSQIAIVLSVILLIFTLILGETKNDATRWLSIPGLGFSFQPSDIAKFSLIFYIARILSINQNDQDKLDASLKQIIIVTGIVCVLILPSNLSTALLLFVTSLVLMFIGRISLKKIGKAIGLLSVAFVLIIAFYSLISDSTRVSTWKNRLISFMQDKDEGISQSSIAKTAIATSGLIGKGPGNSEVKYMLPQVNSDFIFVLIIEEWGLIVAIIVIIAYLALLYRVGLIVKRTSRTFAALLAIGITLMIVFQAFMNMAVAVRITPVTGQPLPLVSMGGTSMLITFAVLGVVLSISRSFDNNTSIQSETEKNTVIK